MNWETDESFRLRIPSVDDLMMNVLTRATPQVDSEPGGEYHNGKNY